MIGYSAFCTMGNTLAYLKLQNAPKRKFKAIMTNQEKIKNWIAHWEAVRDLAAKDGDYPKWEAAEREIKNYEAMLKRWSGKE